MNLPAIISQSTLDALASPDDFFSIRVVLRRTGNTAPYTVRGKKHRYVFERDAALQAHIIDIPASVWMAGFPEIGPYRDNFSIAHDLQGNRAALKAPLVFLIHYTKAPVGLPAQAKVESNAPAMQAFRELLEAMEAPEFVLSAFDLLSSDKSPDEIKTLLEQSLEQLSQDAPDSPPEPSVELSSSTATEELDAEEKRKAANRERQRRYRQQKKKAKAESIV